MIIHLITNVSSKNTTALRLVPRVFGKLIMPVLDKLILRKPGVVKTIE